MLKFQIIKEKLYKTVKGVWLKLGNINIYTNTTPVDLCTVCNGQRSMPAVIFKLQNLYFLFQTDGKSQPVKVYRVILKRFDSSIICLSVAILPTI